MPNLKVMKNQTPDLQNFVLDWLKNFTQAPKQAQIHPNKAQMFY